MTNERRRADTLPRWRIVASASGLVLGTYAAPDRAAALDAMAQDAGYSDAADMDARAPVGAGGLVVEPATEAEADAGAAAFEHKDAQP